MNAGKVMKHVAPGIVRLVVSSVSVLACELDIQLDPGESMAGSGSTGSSGGDPDAETALIPADRFLLAVRVFETEPPLQFLMAGAFDKGGDGREYLLGWTRRIRPDTRQPDGDQDWFVILSGGDEFVNQLDSAVYLTSVGLVTMTLLLDGQVVDQDYFCGQAYVESSDPPVVPQGEMTFAAQRFASQTPLPELVAVDCQGGKVPAF